MQRHWGLLHSTGCNLNEKSSLVLSFCSSYLPLHCTAGTCLHAESWYFHLNAKLWLCSPSVFDKNGNVRVPLFLLFLFFCRPSWISSWKSSAARSVFVPMLFPSDSFTRSAPQLQKPAISLCASHETNTQFSISPWDARFIVPLVRCERYHELLMQVVVPAVSVMTHVSVCFSVMFELSLPSSLSSRAPVLFAALNQTWRWSVTSLKELRFSRSCSALVSSLFLIMSIKTHSDHLSNYCERVPSGLF